MESSRGGNRYDVRIEGGVHGQFAVGEHIHQTLFKAASEARTQEELQRVIADLRTQIEKEVPAELAGRAIERVDELAAAVAKPEPDVSTMEYVKNWFGNNLPKLGGAVTGLIFSPIVGKVVEAAGELAVAEFKRRFGQSPGGGSSAVG